MTKKRIAVIEDDENLLELFKKILKNENYEVVGATNGLDIVKQLFENKPDLILIDLGLPIVSGDKVIDTFKKKDVIGNIPVVIVSGREEAEIKNAVREIGAVAYIKKPVNPQELIKLVKEHIK
ncbi:MAG: hypothetical protein A3J83_04300 [Elusimicrobia bacterium RIFOXYA2_FULL_40_6]|nr:MAG: hypothetical protein A3J83_04300 [Elusimicrobia bacterium RIFOXYA2_FULL_40_6]